MYTHDKQLKCYASSLRRDPTKGEELLWECVRRKRLGAKFIRQKVIGCYIADFYCEELQIVLEVDGVTHESDSSRRYDHRRDDYFRSLGIEVLRIEDSRVFCTMSCVAEEVVALIERRREGSGQVRRSL